MESLSREVPGWIYVITRWPKLQPGVMVVGQRGAKERWGVLGWAGSMEVVRSIRLVQK